MFRWGPNTSLAISIMCITALIAYVWVYLLPIYEAAGIGHLISIATVLFLLTAILIAYQILLNIMEKRREQVSN